MANSLPSFVMSAAKAGRKELADDMIVEVLLREYGAAAPPMVAIRAAYAVNQELVKPDCISCERDDVVFCRQ
jgi:hypothetical protein